MKNQIDILSWNVNMHAFAKNNNYVIDELIELGEPDVVCLQEFVEGKDDSLLKWLESQDYKTTYSPSASLPTDNKISQGVLTAVKKSLKVDMKMHILREDSPRRFRNFSNRRSIVDTVITFSDGSKLSIINFHATLPRPYTIDMRKREFSELIAYLDQLPADRKISLCGDYNFFRY
jgi:exonuclease III